MWIKIVGFILASCAGAYLGFKQSQKYKQREKLLNEAVRLCDCIINDITYFQPTLSQMLKNRLQTFPMLSPIIERYTTLLDSKKNINRTALINYIPKIQLNDEEYMLLIQLLDILGKSDSSTQRGGILSIKEAFLIKQGTAIEECKKYGGLYFRLGVLGGIAIGVIIL
jgi:stage III sporulation protein AB